MHCNVKVNTAAIVNGAGLNRFNLNAFVTSLLYKRY